LGRVFPSEKASLARGRLTRDWDESSGRFETDEFSKTLHSGTEDADKKVVHAVAKIAEKRSLSCALITLFLDFKRLHLLSSVLRKHHNWMMLLRHFQLCYPKITLLYLKRHIFPTA
jgi:hypothetical protein